MIKLTQSIYASTFVSVLFSAHPIKKIMRGNIGQRFPTMKYRPTMKNLMWRMMPSPLMQSLMDDVILLLKLSRYQQL